MSTKALHPEISASERRQLFFRGIELFNTGEYFLCHEAWEEIWRSTTPEPRDLFQGLIQVAVGIYHFRVRRRPKVALRVMGKGRRRLEAVRHRPHGLDLEALLFEVAAWESWLAAPTSSQPPWPRIQVRDRGAVK